LNASEQHGTGLLGSARLVLASLLEIGHTRLQLASTELEEERLRVAELLLHATLALFFLGVGLVLGSLLIVLLFWESHRLLALGSVTALHLGIGAYAAVVWQKKARNKPPLLAATIAELRRDQAAFQQAVHDAQRAATDVP
jgi:uncharacterized membrane protein YqjE